MTPDVQKPPPHLSPEARKLYEGYVRGWAFDHAGRTVLMTALEAFDRMRGAQACIRKQGLMVKGRTHPAVLVERDARLAMLRALRQLGLDLEPLRDRPGRPGGEGPV